MSRPFDEARYKGLLEGLEITVIKRSEAFVENPGDRLDSEFFLKETLRTFQLIKQVPNEFVSSLVEKVQHPRELERNYEDSGLHVVLAQNVRNNFFEFAEKAYMPENVRAILAANLVVAGDMLMTRSGANYGQTAAWMEQDGEAFACADLLVFRKPRCPSGYLSTFFSTSHGKRLIDRGAYGMAQPHIAPSYLEIVRVPRFAILESQIDSLVKGSDAKFSESDGYISQAEKTLLHALGLQNWQPAEPLTYTRRASEAFTVGRLDSDYFAPRVLELLKKLGEAGLTVGAVAPTRHERFYPGKESKFNYIEIGNVRADGTVGAERLPQNAAPSRATSYVRAGDVITSSVRPIRRLSAIITPEQDGFVCSSGFVVLEPRDVPAEVLLTYLRLPPFCELMDLHTSASLYPAISEADLLALPFHPIAKGAELEIVNAVQSAHAARRQAHALLEAAKHAVEIAIEQGEAEAVRFLLESRES